MKKKDNIDASHLTWLIENRSRNQQASLALFQIMRERRPTMVHPASAIAHDLIGATFSLWRAVFLADITSTTKNTLADAEEFLGKIIVDNAINYPQDRSMREYSFYYYVNSAAFRLMDVSTRWSPEIVPPERTQIRLPIDADYPKYVWEFWQAILTDAIPKFAEFVK